ncbi:MAG: hypothetical protein QM775_30855 [Pirellulales bacterium]
MGQYFKLVNLDKKELVCPWCLDGGAKLWEWAANTQSSVLALLLRKSDEGGGGDYYGYKKGCGEGGSIECQLSPIVGRWAGDRIALVGDYDSSKLWNTFPQFRNISEQVAAEWNEFIELPDRQLQYRDDCGCTKQSAD